MHRPCLIVVKGEFDLYYKRHTFGRHRKKRGTINIPPFTIYIRPKVSIDLKHVITVTGACKGSVIQPTKQGLFTVYIAHMETLQRW